MSGSASFWVSPTSPSSCFGCLASGVTFSVTTTSWPKQMVFDWKYICNDVVTTDMSRVHLIYHCFLVVKCSLLGHGLFLTLQRLRCCSKACRVLGSSYPSSIQSRLQQSLLNFWLNLLLKTSKKILLTCHEAPHLDPPWSHHPMMAGKDLSYLNPLKCLRWIGSIWSRSRHGHVTVIRQM